MQQFICPVCRSVLEPYGIKGTPFVDSWPAEQRVPCPVCGYPISITGTVSGDGSGWLGIPRPVLWQGWNIIKTGGLKVKWEDVKARAPALDKPAEATPVYLPTGEAVKYGLETSAKEVGEVAGKITQEIGQVAGQGVAGVLKGLGTTGIIFVVILVTIVLMARQK